MKMENKYSRKSSSQKFPSDVFLNEEQLKYAFFSGNLPQWVQRATEFI